MMMMRLHILLTVYGLSYDKFTKGTSKMKINENDY